MVLNWIKRMLPVELSLHTMLLKYDDFTRLRQHIAIGVQRCEYWSVKGCRQQTLVTTSRKQCSRRDLAVQALAWCRHSAALPDSRNITPTVQLSNSWHQLSNRGPRNYSTENDRRNKDSIQSYLCGETDIIARYYDLGKPYSCELQWRF